MSLTAKKIIQEIQDGRLVIEPFNPQPTFLGGQLGPNSYDVRLGPTLFVLGGKDLDFKLSAEFERVEMEPSGYILLPGKFYLGCTLERTHTPFHVPWIDGRSTVARYGLAVHVTAGRGDIGFNGHWTLELKNLTNNPIRIYPTMRIAQVSFSEPTGEIDPQYTYAGRYNEPKPVPVLPVPNNF